MKKFINNVIIFLIIILLFNGILFLFAINKYYKGYKKIPGREYSSFILSDSHGIPIGNFSEKYGVFNFSVGSDSYFDMKRKISYLLLKRYNVDTIFITVDDHTLSPYRVNTNNLDRSVVYTSPIDYENYLIYLKEKYLKYYFPIFQPKIASLFKAYLKANLTFNKKPKNNVKKGNNLNNNGWNNLPDDEKIKRAENRKKFHFTTDNNKSEKLEKELLDIIKICQTNKIELIGIKFPLSRTYIKTLGNSSYGADELFISNGLKVIDTKFLYFNNEEYFENQDHMNAIGGEIFTKHLLMSKMSNI